MSLAVGRRRRGASTRWHIQVPEDLALRFDTLHIDRGRSKLIFGARSQIVSELLENYVREIEARLASSRPTHMEPSSR